MKPIKGLAGISAGSLLIVAGGLMLAFPTTSIFLHPGGSEDLHGPVFLERVTRESSRIYGVLGLLIGSGLIWFSGWPRWSARRAAIEDYVWSLSQELSRRFGTKEFYSVEDVSRVAAESSVSVKYIAYAHAMFCSRPDFVSHYPASSAGNYDGLRAVIARRCFDGSSGFDASTVIRFATPPREEEYDACEVSGG